MRLSSMLSRIVPHPSFPLIFCLALIGYPAAAQSTAAAASPVGESAAIGISTGSAVSMASLPAHPPARTEFFPLSGIHRGLTGVAYTVFEGTTPEPMGVEILGVLKDAIGPGQDMILAKLTGAKAEYTGVVAGMSGSPVYIDGKLVGALSYRIGQFSKEPICGITPIEQMLEVRDGQATAEGMRVAEGAVPQPDAAGAAATATGLSVVAPPAQSAREVQPIETALNFGGFSQHAIDLFGDRFRAMGMSPVAGLGGAAPAGTHEPEPIVPGSAVSAVLVRGDLNISGTCTVTYVDPHQLLACGHPITQFGPVEMPMTKAEVLATLASPMNSFKIINTTDTVGEFTEDRASAILGRFGETARMIPVSVDVVPPDSADTKQAAVAGNAAYRAVSSREESGQIPGQITPIPPAGAAQAVAPHGLKFEVLDNRALTPQAMLMSVYQSVSGINSAENQMSYRMSGELTIKGQPAVHMDGIMAPNEQGSGAVAAALYVNDRFSRLYANSLDQPLVTGLHLTLQEMPGRRSAVLEGARLSAMEVHPGDTLELEATVHPYQAAPEVVRMKVKLPETLSPGSMRIVVSDAAMVDKLTASGGGTGAMPGMIVIGGPAVHPEALSDEVAQMNRAHANDRLYVTLLDHSTQAAFDTEALPEVPLSMANVLEPLRASQKVQLNGESAIEAGSMEVGYELSGSQVLTVDVR